jgi:hypothetical protein
MSTAFTGGGVLSPRADFTDVRAPTTRIGAMTLPPAARFPALSQLSLPGSFARPQGRTLNNIVVTLIACGLWLITLRLEVGGEYEAFAKRQILGLLTVHVAITLAVLLFYLAVDGGYLGRLFSRSTFVIAALGVLYVFAVGLVRNGNTLLFREECYAIRWFAVGFMLMRVAITQKGIKLFLLLSAVATAVLLYLIMEKATSETLADTSIRRVTTSNMWPVAYCGFISIGLMLNALWPLGTQWQVVGLSALTTVIVVGSVRTSTRSLFAVQAAMLVMTLFALARDPRMTAKLKWLNRLQLFLLAGVVLYLGRQIVTGRIFASISLISRRFLGSEGTGSMRIKELTDMFADFGPIDWLFGGGLGSYFVTELGWWTARPHIAYFTWLQKGGLVIFLAATVLIYARTMWSFAAALLTKNRSARLSYAGMPKPILVVGPPLLAWFSTTFISGGFDNGSMLALGGLSALWIQLEDETKLLLPARYGSHATSAVAANPFATNSIA